MERLIQLVFSDGERYPMLVDGQGMADFWVTLYVTERLRPSLKQTAIENTIRSLIHLKLWETAHGRDLVSEFSSKRFLSDPDVVSIRDHCFLDTRSLRKWLQSTSSPNVRRLALSHPSSTPPLHAVSKAHAANRLLHMADFLHFTARTLLRQRSDFATLVGAIDDMKKRIVAHKPRGLGDKGLATEADSKAPPPEAFELLMDVVKVDSPDNPFKNPAIRKRNALMFEILYDTGMRAGEVLALQIGDIDYHGATISVVRRHDNPDDPRKRQPVAKTLGRTIPISKSLVLRVREYVMEVRALLPGANKHPFLFVTHKGGQFQGQPISDTTFRNRILKPVTSVNPELFDEITRHGFRHNFNYRLSRRIDMINEKAKSDPSIKPISEKEELQIRKQINGWSSDETAQTYNLRHITELANKLMREEMDDLSKYLHKDK